MRLLRYSFTLLSLALTAHAAEFTLFKNVWGDVIVSTDTTVAGRSLTPPTPRQPVYYKGLSLGRKLGSLAGDTEPEAKQLNKFVAEVLAKQGYLAAKPGGPEPTLLLVIQWGIVQTDLLWFLGYNADQDIGAPVMGGMLGPEVFRRGMRSTIIQTILDDAKEVNYGIIVTAFEPKSARTAHPVAYWQTRIGLPITGKTMAEALPTMLIAAGPSIGRPSDKPVLADADHARDGTVEFGELQFLDVLQESPAGSADKAGEKK